MIAEGDAFLLSLPTDPEVKHFYVVLSDPSRDSDNIVIANLSTWQDGEDDACFLNSEDWCQECPFLNHDSYVRYRSARLVSASKIEEWLREGIASSKENMGCRLLEAMRRGAEESRFLPNKCCLALNDQGLIDL